jgi:hypothetical protein
MSAKEGKTSGRMQTAARKRSASTGPRPGAGSGRTPGNTRAFRANLQDLWTFRPGVLARPIPNRVAASPLADDPQTARDAVRSRVDGPQLTVDTPPLRLENDQMTCDKTRTTATNLKSSPGAAPVGHDKLQTARERERDALRSAQVGSDSTPPAATHWKVTVPPRPPRLADVQTIAASMRRAFANAQTVHDSCRDPFGDFKTPHVTRAPSVCAFASALSKSSATACTCARARRQLPVTAFSFASHVPRTAGEHFRSRKWSGTGCRNRLPVF